jgi:hypothetical protein
VKRLVIAISLLGLFGVSCTRTISETPSSEQSLIVDAHGHLNKDMSAERLIELMDKVGVSRMVLMARYYKSKHAMGYASDELALEYSKKYPGRFIPFIAGQRESLLDKRRWLEPDYIAEGFLEEVETKLKSGDFYGIGELIIRHYAYSRGDGQGGSDVDIPVDTPLMRHLADLAGRYRVPLLIHAEGEPEVVSGMDTLLSYNQNMKVIWAHNCGRSSVEIIRNMLSRHPNLLCDLGGMQNASFAGYGRYWPKRTPWMFLIEDGSGNLYPAVKALFEEFPERFLLGTDCAHTPALKNYVKRIERNRKLLSGLKLETARRIAFQNAEELFAKK